MRVCTWNAKCCTDYSLSITHHRSTTHLHDNYHRIVLQRPERLLIEHKLHFVVSHYLTLDLRVVRRPIDLKADGCRRSTARAAQRRPAAIQLETCPKNQVKRKIYMNDVLLCLINQSINHSVSYSHVVYYQTSR